MGTDAELQLACILPANFAVLSNIMFVSFHYTCTFLSRFQNAQHNVRLLSTPDDTKHQKYLNGTSS